MNDVKRNERHDTVSLCEGTMLRGRYRIEGTLGQGGYGITYSAYDTKKHYRVAVKELFPTQCVVRSENRQTVCAYPGQDADFRYLRENFEKEAGFLIELQHLEGIVRLMHVFSENNTAYYIMELLEGESLLDRLKREGPMSWEQLAPILKTIFMALEQIHSVGLIHRDISPDNIFLTKDGARLIDFGSARHYQTETHLTAVVKKNFAPWEQYLPAGHQGPWTDIYSLSVTAYYCLSGQLPPPAIERKVKDNLVPLELLRPGVPKYVCAAIQQGMMLMPENRFQDVRHFRNALRQKERNSAKRTPRGYLMCLHGNFAGRKWHLQPDCSIRIGRNVDCDVCYPGNYPGVSRNQCTIYYTKDGKILVKDDRSRYGTRLKSPDKSVMLEPEIWYNASGAHLFFGAKEEYVLLR